MAHDDFNFDIFAQVYRDSSHKYIWQEVYSQILLYYIIILLNSYIIVV